MVTLPAYKEPKPETEYPLEWGYVQKTEGIYAMRDTPGRVVVIAETPLPTRVALYVTKTCAHVVPARETFNGEKFRRVQETLVIGFKAN